MAEMKFPCSSCGVTLKVGNSALAGKKLRCPKCAAIMVIPAAADDAASPQPARTAAPKPSQPKPSSNPASASAKPGPQGKARPSIQTVREEAEPAPVQKKKAALAPAASGEPAARARAKPMPADREDDSDDKASLSEGKGKRRGKGLAILLISVGVLVLAALGAVGAVYFGFLPSPFASGTNQQVAGKGSVPKQQSQGAPYPSTEVVDGPKRESRDEENRLIIERKNKHRAVASIEQTVVADLAKSDAAKGDKGNELALLLGGDGKEVTQATFSPDSQYLVSVVKDGPVRLWDLRTGKVKQEFPGLSAYENVVAFSPVNKQLAALDQPLKIRLFDLSTGKQQGKELSDEGLIRTIAFAPDGRWIYGGSRKKVERWEVATRNPAPPLTVEGVDFSHFALRPDGKVLAALVEPSTVQLWELETGKRYRQTHPVPQSFDLSMVFSPDGWTLAVLDPSAKVPGVDLFNLETGVKTQLKVDTQSISSIAFSPDGMWLAVGGTKGPFKGTLQLWDVAKGQKKHQVDSDRLGSVQRVAFSPGGTLLATADSLTAVRIWVVADIVNGFKK